MDFGGLSLDEILTISQFLYRCTTGMVDRKANGCIMADEMGLGKTVRQPSLGVHTYADQNSFNA